MLDATTSFDLSWTHLPTILEWKWIMPTLKSIYLKLNATTGPSKSAFALLTITFHSNACSFSWLKCLWLTLLRSWTSFPAGVCWTIFKMTFGHEKSKPISIPEKSKPISIPHNNNETQTWQMTMTMTHVSPTTMYVLTNTDHEQDTNHGWMITKTNKTLSQFQ